MYCLSSIYNKFALDDPSLYAKTAPNWYNKHESLITENVDSYVLGIIINLHNELMNSSAYKTLKLSGCILLSVVAISSYFLSLVESVAYIATLILKSFYICLVSLRRWNFQETSKSLHFFLYGVTYPIVGLLLRLYTALEILTKNATLKPHIFDPNNLEQLELVEEVFSPRRPQQVPSIVIINSHITQNRPIEARSPIRIRETAFSGEPHRLGNNDSFYPSSPFSHK